MRNVRVHAYAALAVLHAVSCATAPPIARDAVGRVTAPAPRAAREGIHVERIALHFNDPHHAAAVLAAGPGRALGVEAVLVDDATGELVIFGTEEAVGRVRAMLKPSCQLPLEPFEVVALERGDARAIARAVAPVLPRDVRIVIDEATNQLVVTGPSQALADVVPLVKTLEHEATP